MRNPWPSERYRRPMRPRREWLILIVTLLISLLWMLAAYLMIWRVKPSTHNAPPLSSRMKYDAVIVPGGGLDAKGEPATWVTARLDAALVHDQHTDFYLVLSRGTTHKPPPNDSDGFPVDEAAASARHGLVTPAAPYRA